MPDLKSDMQRNGRRVAVALHTRRDTANLFQLVLTRDALRARTQSSRGFHPSANNSEFVSSYLLTI